MTRTSGVVVDFSFHPEQEKNAAHEWEFIHIAKIIKSLLNLDKGFLEDYELIFVSYIFLSSRTWVSNFQDISYFRCLH